VHGAGFMHRDIKPGNIIITAKGAPVLVDFGAARQEVGGKSRSITRVVTPGYAPIEQYSMRGKQGPWTDIYALGAVAYRAITGDAPPDATERVRGDDMPPAAEAAHGQYSASLLRAIDWALAVDEDRRPQGDAWRRALVGEARAQKPATVAPQSKATVKHEVWRKVEEKKSSGWAWAAAVVGVLIVGGWLVEWGNQRQEAEAVALLPSCNASTFRTFLSIGYESMSTRWREQGKSVPNRDEFFERFNALQGQNRTGALELIGEELWERRYKDKISHKEFRRRLIALDFCRSHGW